MVVQFAFYTLVGGFSAIVNLLLFLGLHGAGLALGPAALSAFFIAAFVNYYLSIKLIFRHGARWATITEFFVFLVVVASIGVVDMVCTRFFVAGGVSAMALEIARDCNRARPQLRWPALRRISGQKTCRLETTEHQVTLRSALHKRTRATLKGYSDA